LDPLSDVLALLKPRSYVSGGFAVDGDLAIKFPKHSGIKCYAILSGQCWLTVEGIADPLLLTAGDCYILPRGLPFSLSTDPSLTPVDFQIILAARNLETVSAPANGEGCYLVGGHFAFAAKQSTNACRSYINQYTRSTRGTSRSRLETGKRNASHERGVSFNRL
jgi:hypothetical protein